MAITLNELLLQDGIDPGRVRLLRHHHAEPRRKSPYQLWLTDRPEFDRYQATQDSRARKEFEGWFWASFVVPQPSETLFVGLYEANERSPVPRDWIDPISSQRPGAEKGREYDLYGIELAGEMARYRGALKIDWGSGTRRWNQRADQQNKPVVWIGTEIDQRDIADRDATMTMAGISGLEAMSRSFDPERRERLSSYIERGPIGEQVKRRRGGRCQICEALGLGPVAFVKPDGTPYSEAHHVFPVGRLIKGSLASANIMVLCPNHHREIHYGTMRLVNQSARIRQFEAAGRRISIERN
jgi:hypothetical protein